MFALHACVFVGCNACRDEVCCPTGCCCFGRTGVANGDAWPRGLPQACAAMVEMVSTALCCWGWELRLDCSCLGSTRQVCSDRPEQRDSPLLLGFWPHPALVIQSPGASDSTCCQRSGAVRVRQPQAFALSPALPAARPILRSAAPASPLKPSPNKREVQPEQGGQRLALTAPRSDGGALQPAASRFPPCSRCPSPPQASVNGLDLEASAAPQHQGLPPGVRHPGAASWKAPAPTTSLQQELSSFFSPLERVAGQLPGLRGST